MPDRTVVAKELATFLTVLGHPLRVRMVEELRLGEMDVTSIYNLLGISQAEASRQLAILRTHRVVVENRQGRKVYYRLRDPEVATWLMEGLSFIDPDPSEASRIHRAVLRARTLWSREAGHDNQAR